MFNDIKRFALSIITNVTTLSNNFTYKPSWLLETSSPFEVRHFKLCILYVI